MPLAPAQIHRTEPAANKGGRSSSVPVPRPGESQPQFAVRFHAAMAQRMPDTDQRNRACFAAWDRANAGSNPIDHLARKRFGSERFVRVDAVPYFAEHVAVDDGGRKRYDRQALAEIVEHNNGRAEDLDLWCPICEGHTPTADQYEAGAKAPPIIGYAGNYRLGMVGRKRPKWCVFADEWHHAESAGDLKRMPRRSVEIWEDGTIDPVAALGATTPRLDVGMTRFYRDPVRGLVRKYAAMPAADNVYVPGHAGEKSDKRRYAAEDSMASDEHQIGQMTLGQLINALTEWEPMQWVMSQMQDAPDRVEGDDDLSDDPIDDVDDGEFAAADDVEFDDDVDDGPVMDAETEGDDAMLSDDELAGMADDERADYDGLDDADKATYARGFRRGRRSHPKASHPMRLSRSASGDTDAKRYAREAKSRRQKEAKANELAGLRAKVAKLERESRHAKRYARLEEKRSEGYVFDVEEELDDVADLDEQQFERHLDRIASRYQRIPIGGGDLPTFDLPRARNARERDDYSRKRASRAREIAMTDGISFGAALKKVDAELANE